MKSPMHSVRIAAPITAFATLLLAGCQTAENPSPQPTAQAPAPVTQASAPATPRRTAATAPATLNPPENRDSGGNDNSSDSSDSDGPGGGDNSSWN